ncbi:EamA domain-containing protein [Desulfonema limicola]|uniref:EamA domain-containing protein n=1 Tax=Desulfonema limicola TaxID=45656 RepID=A0A975B7S5_9BACT|nr:DMT family transporter [Desulfonema limicola]QTA80461.1 EamA domain-containing protein [Desulfonema limicola]
MIIYIKLLLTAFFWGGTFIAGRMLSDHVSPASAAFLRFTIASILLFLLVLKVEGKLPLLNKKQFIAMLFLGLTGVFTYNIFFFKGLKLITAGRASLIIANNPIIITLFSAYLFKEKLNLIKITGIALSVFGAVVVISKGEPWLLLSGSIGLGDFYIFMCVISWVLFSLIGKTILSDISPLVSIAYSSAIGTAALFFPAFSENIIHNFFIYTPIDWLCIAYLGIFGTVIGFIWYYEGIKTIGPSRASLFINFVPISAIILAFFILNEPITLSLLTGAVFVSTGVIMTNTRIRTKSIQAVSG